MRYFEDLRAGEVAELGSYMVTEAEILAFARQYDPQPFHLDPEAAKQSLFGGLVASGWHTAAIAMRLLVDGFFSGLASMGSPGVDELRWPRPVRPGDTLRGRVTLLECLPSRSRPNLGIARLRTELANQADETVLITVAAVFVGRRPDHQIPGS